MEKIAVVGAGISGLSVAQLLKGKAEVTLFEKSKGVSGRVATRNSDPYFFDHGAQYFTVRTDPFREFINPLIKNGLVKRWNARYVKFDKDRIIERKNWEDLEPRYVGVPTMNTLGKSLSFGCNIITDTKINKLERNKQWELQDDRGNRYKPFDWVISSIPSPQVISLLPSTFTHFKTIQEIEMRACLSLMLGFETPLAIEFEAAHVTNTDLSWLAVNSHKPGRSNDFTLLVHSTEYYAEAQIDCDRTTVIDDMCLKTSKIVGCDLSGANFKNLHAWRYANNARREKSPVLIDWESNLAACGDWGLGGRVEGAFTSAYRLVKEIEKSL